MHFVVVYFLMSSMVSVAADGHQSFTQVYMAAMMAASMMLIWMPAQRSR